ncbi:hypothetical protein ACLOJK_034589 [Asimina triloba]
MSATAEAQKPEDKKAVAGELLFCGGTSWDIMGRKVSSVTGNFYAPTRLRPLLNADIRFVAAGCYIPVVNVLINISKLKCLRYSIVSKTVSWSSLLFVQLAPRTVDILSETRDKVKIYGGIIRQYIIDITSTTGTNITARVLFLTCDIIAICSSCHCVALDVEGRCYTWGRNEKGQLGHGDTVQRDMPTVVSELSKYKIVSAGAGRHHTVVVTDDGNSFSFGWNKHGQLGTGSTRNEVESSPVRCLVPQAKHAVCGADFTVWLSSVEGASILTAGLPQYGQLGHGTDNEYNVKESSVRLAYEAQPRPRAIASFSSKTIVKVACGANHTVAVDSNGFVYTWGFGGYGRLGHREQKDEWVPRLVEVFQRQNVLPPTAVVSAGSVNSACTAGGGQLYMWGKLKTTGDDWMYPKPVMDLRSSANPKKVDILEGMHVLSVACGMGHSLVVVDRTNISDRLEKLEVLDGPTPNEVLTETESQEPTKKKSTKKGAADATNSKKRKKSKESSSESEKEEESDDDSEEEANGGATIKKGRGGIGSNRGRGRGGKRPATQEKKSAGQGLGRPRADKKSSRPARGHGKAGKKGKSRK